MIRLRPAALLLLAALALGTLFSGCATTSTAQGNTIPWSRPQQWEGGIPGMGNITGSTGGSTGNGLR